MEPEMIYAIDRGIKSFMEGESCSPQLKALIKEDWKSKDSKDFHFHDLVTAGIVATISGFIAQIAANIATEYFKNKRLSRENAKQIGHNSSKIILNELRLKIGPAACEEITISKIEIDSISEHTLESCKRVNDG